VARITSVESNQEVAMTAMIAPADSFAETRQHPLTTAVLVVLFWLAAAALAVATHVGPASLSATACAVLTSSAIVVAAYCYTRICARQAGITHALGVGVTWLVLSIVVEITVTSRIGHGWHDLLGSHDRPLLRNVLMFVWIFAPAIFARGEESY
jgi:hypothetical protein